MKKKTLCVTMLLLGSMFIGCGNTDTQKMTGQASSELLQDETNIGITDSDKISAEDDAESDVSKDTQTDVENVSQPEKGAVTEASTENAVQNDANAENKDAMQSEQENAISEEFSFADVANREFYFSSGAGGWYTVVYIHDDGSFDGHYRDGDMGSTGDGYPNGTVYYSEFSGRFTKPEKINDTTYSFEIDAIEYANEVEEEIKDGFYYYYTTAYGLVGAEEFYMYLPGTKIEDLPEGYTSWVHYYYEEAVSGAELSFYGLYNVTMEEGFSSYEILSALENATITIETAEETVAGLEEKLSAAQAQQEMNQLSYEIYKAWDEALNSIWSILKSELDEETMETLTTEERAWIVEKEEAVKKVGEENGGGSLQPLLQNDLAAEMTKERVYELLEYLKK